MISVVIPCFRSSNGIELLHKRLTESLLAIGREYELIFVEDCGGDDTWRKIELLANIDPYTRGIKLARNYGQHNALLCGVRAAKGGIIVTIDDDLQNPPEEIEKLITKLEKGHDVVYGHPSRETHGLLRNLASRITKIALQGTMGVESASKVSAFRAFRISLRNAFRSYHNPSVNLDVLLTWGTTNFSFVEVRQDERAFGDSGYSLRKLINHAANMITGFSTLPLQIASIFGLLFGSMGFLILAYAVGQYFILGSSVPGFTFLASIISIFSGVQLLTLGIFGEYLARMHFRSMERPPYVTKEETKSYEDSNHALSPDNCKHEAQ